MIKLPKTEAFLKVGLPIILHYFQKVKGFLKVFFDFFVFFGFAEIVPTNRKHVSAKHKNFFIVNYFSIEISSTVKMSVEYGPMSCPAPCAP